MAFFRKRSNDNSAVPLLSVRRGAEEKSIVAAAQKSLEPAPLVSVVIPVYNAMPYLTELLNSLEAQDLKSEDFEVIAVDDGSTDFGGEILDIYAKRNSNFNVVHQENSGWPGKPRNVGIDHARGEYVFFIDSDDRLGVEALRRMTSFALKHDVDVLVPKMVGLDGRRVQAKLFGKTILDVDYDFILRTLSPQKMIRRSLLNSHGIRFVEEKVRLEDGIAMVEAYSAAQRISILGDYNYYEIRLRSDGQNISTQRIDPAGYVDSLSKIAQTIADYTGADLVLARKRIAGLFVRKGLRFYDGQRFLRFTAEQREAWLSNHKGFLETFHLDNPAEFFKPQDARLVAAILDSDIEYLEEHARKKIEAEQPPAVVSIENTAENVSLIVDLPATGPAPKGIHIRDRDTEILAMGEIAVDDSGSRMTASFSRESVLESISRLGNFFIEYQGVPAKRIKMGNNVANQEFNGLLVYATANGYLSVDTRQAR